MRPAPDEILQRLQHLQAGLQRAGVKLTAQRVAICRALAGSDAHPDAETVYRAVRGHLPTLSRDTVYRTLARLVALGLITRLGAAPGRMRFDGAVRAHHHFCCVRCGAIADVACEALAQGAVPAAVHACGQVQTVQVTVYGLCRRCGRETAAGRPETIREEDA